MPFTAAEVAVAQQANDGSLPPYVLMVGLLQKRGEHDSDSALIYSVSDFEKRSRFVATGAVNRPQFYFINDLVVGSFAERHIVR